MARPTHLCLAFITAFSSPRSATYAFSSSPAWRRPSIGDVERISRGERAKQRGVGSRRVPHRLNANERAVFDRAKAQGYLVCNGRAWRAERAEAPLLNSHRNLRDALGAPAIVVAKDASGDDTVLCDLSPLRLAPGDVERRAAAYLETFEGGHFTMADATAPGDAADFRAPQARAGVRARAEVMLSKGYLR